MNEYYLLLKIDEVYVKERQDFIAQGGKDAPWARNWIGPIAASSADNARDIGIAMRNNNIMRKMWATRSPPDPHPFTDIGRDGWRFR